MAHWLEDAPAMFAGGERTARPRDAGTARELARNRLLGVLAKFHNDFRAMRRRRFALGETWPTEGVGSHDVVFPIEAVATLVQESLDGHWAPLALVGNDGVWDAKAFSHPPRMGARRWIVHAGGDALVMDRARAVAAGQSSEDVHRALCDWDRVLLGRVAQSALCNRHHDVQQQVASWFLVNQRRYRLGEVGLTQTVLAKLLGLRRESVSRCIGRLVDAHALAARHSVLAIANAGKLKLLACECWQAGE